MTRTICATRTRRKVALAAACGIFLIPEAVCAQSIPGNTMTDLGTLGGSRASVGGVSADGSVVVGMSHLLSGDQNAYRWTSAGGMVDLGTLGGTDLLRNKRRQRRRLRGRGDK